MITFKELKRNLKKDTSTYPNVKVAVLGDTATQFLSTAIKGMGIERGYHINLYEADYNQVERQFLDPTSDLYSFNPDYIIVFQSAHKLSEEHSMRDASEREKIADDRLAFIEQMCQLTTTRIIYLNYPEIEDTVFGSYANKVSSSFTYQVRKLNMGLMEISQKYSNLFICDILGLQNKLGRDVMFAPNVYMSTEMVLSIDALPYVASRVVDIILAIQGKFKKCLILDLDNTLWGGIIGDDGVEGIQLGHGLGIGKAFTEFQMWIKKLKDRGIILCVCSKNTESIAKEPFEKHPDMVLRLSDIAVFMANWETKVDNIRNIQKILNIGFDSMVFLDDNPFERNMVRDNIKEITVPELPEDPGDYLEYLYGLNLFETATYSNADKDRTKQYQVEAQRVTFAKSFESEADFLKSLNMVATVSGFTKFNTPRVAQLSQRSNQFNLRTVRYTEDQIEAIENDNKQKGFAFTLKDKFGDNGLISVIILKEQDVDTVFIDTWFMSCRVLKRGMEDFALNTIVNWAKTKGYKYIIGEYISSPKNSMVAEHYPHLGFERIPDQESSLWRLEVDSYEKKKCFINIQE